jgi:hypothetical protein
MNSLILKHAIDSIHRWSPISRLDWLNAGCVTVHSHHDFECVTDWITQPDAQDACSKQSLESEDAITFSVTAFTCWHARHAQITDSAPWRHIYCTGGVGRVNMSICQFLWCQQWLPMATLRDLIWDTSAMILQVFHDTVPDTASWFHDSFALEHLLDHGSPSFWFGKVFYLMSLPFSPSLQEAS